MQLANPYALLLLGFIPILILIHSLKPKPKRVEVTNLFLWQEALREKAGGIRIQKIINNILLLLQIAAVIMTAFALANPLVAKRSELKGDVILVIDSSASMKARGPDGIRFEMAQDKALQLIEKIPRGTKVLVIEAGMRPLLRSPFIDDKKRLRNVIRSIRPTDAPGDLQKTIYLALSFMDPDRNDRIFFITDGADRNFKRLADLHPKMETVLISGGTKNVGITKFEFRQELDFKDRYEILLEVKNFNPNAVLCPIRLVLDKKTFLKKTIGLRPHEKRLLIFPYSGLIAGTAEVFLENDDDFPTDNRAFAVLSSSQEIWVLLVTKGNFFLERLLNAYPNVRVNSIKEIIATSWAEQTKRHDIVILDRTSHPLIERGNFLLIHTLSPSIPIKEIGKIENPRVLDWDRKSPLMEGLNMGDLKLEYAMKVRAEAPLKPILESQDTGLMYAYEKKGIRAVFMGFDLTRSDLPLRVAFPVMMSNIFNWLYPNKLRFSSHQVQAGKPFAIYLDVPTKEISVRTPLGKWEKHRVEESPYVYSNTNEVGIYTIAEGKRRRNFAVNLVDEEESDIRTSHVQEETEGSIESTLQTVISMVSIWPYLLFLGCAILFLEWYIWCKRQ